MSKRRFFFALIALILVCSTLISTEPFRVLAAGTEQNTRLSKLYLADVKMFYGLTEEAARKSCEKEGYIFCPTDLNEGGPTTASVGGRAIMRNGSRDIYMGIYMGYKTTENPKNAITDLTLLDMKYTHFEEIEYEEFLNAHVEDFRNQAGQMMTLVRELDMKYRAGSPNAILAYDLLNLFYVDESKSHSDANNLLGHYLINETDITFFEKFLQRGNAMVLNRILDLLCTATSDFKEDGTTWVDRARNSEVISEYVNGTSETKNMYDANCQDGAKKLAKAIREFRETYLEAKARLDAYGETLGYDELEGATAEDAVEKMEEAGLDCRYPEFTEALTIYSLLDAFVYQKKGDVVVNNVDLLYADEDGEETEKTEKPVTYYTKNVSLAEYIMNLAADEGLEDHLSALYPVVYALSPAQRAALSLCGFPALVKGLFQSEDYLSKRDQTLKDAQKKLKDCGYSDGRMCVWEGMDTSLYGKKVAQTDATKEAVAAGLDLQTSQAEAARKESSDFNQALIVIDVCTLGVGGLVMIGSAIAGSSFWSLGMSLMAKAGTFLITQMASYFATATLGVLACALQVINILAIVVGVVMLVYSILKWTGVLDQPDPIDYDSIPDVVFDARINEDGKYQVRYDSVTSNASESLFVTEDGTDLVLMDPEYLSADHAELTCYQGKYDRWLAMYYSKAPAAGEPIEIIPGKEPFVTSGQYLAPDGYQPLKLITGATSVDVNDIEVWDKKGSPLYVFFPGEDTGKITGKMGEDDGTYVTNVRLVHHDKEDDAINLLKKAKFTPIEVNLTPYKGYTYIGYQLGGAGDALTDIRVANVANNDTIVFGDASYGKRGGDGTEYTPDNLALYATKSPSAGSPIVSLSILYERQPLGSGLEPVCLFSGGNAVDFGHMWKNNYAATGKDDDFNYLAGMGRNNYTHEFVQEDDPANGVYLYFQPQEQFLSKTEEGKDAQRYVSGFSYFLAANKETSDSRFGTNYEFMQTFAKENGFELLQDKDGAFRVMSEEAGEMTLATMWRDVGGYPVDTYNFDQVHTIHSVSGNGDGGKKLFGTLVVAGSDGGLTHDAGFYFNGTVGGVCSYLTRENENMIYHTAMYFGVSYTYNPYRAITGVAGLVTPYTESSSQIKYTGMKTPAGTFQACNVSIQGSPIMSAGITAGYYNPATTALPLYTNYNARQKPEFDWMTDQETEILSRYLLTSGPRAGVPALKEGDIVFRTGQKPGKVTGYVPLCDLRTPGDYEHPMNLALETSNMGSKYLYLYLKTVTGEKITDVDEKTDENGKVTAASTYAVNHQYTAKKYVIAVVCGVGRNAETAIRNLYENAAGMWDKLAAKNKDVYYRPLFTQFDEIIPVDLSAEHPWYELKINDTSVSSLKNGEWVRGNEAAYYRWEGHASTPKDKSIDEYEADQKCAYIGVIRGATKANAAYGILKYYTDKDVASDKLNAGSTECLKAGGPIRSPEGKYFLYYSTNSGTAAYSAPVTGLHVSDDIFINGYNTSFAVSESDRVNNALPQFGQLRMRTDEYKYIHIGYDRSAVPYYEALYLGVGNTKEEAFTDMIGTTNAYAAVDVNCNYNSFSGKWIAIGYRRTATKKNAIRDVFLYSGENPPDQIRVEGGFMAAEGVNENNRKITVYNEFQETKKVSGVEQTYTGVPYKLVKHNLISGAEVVSLNEGNGGPGLYLYYTTSEFFREQSAESEVTPITNIAFTYGDISPRLATSSDLAHVFERSYYAAKAFDVSAYEKPVWECVLGVSGSPENWKLTGEGASRFSLNKGVVPGLDGNAWKGEDNRVYMYVDRALKKVNYVVRENGKLPEFGYYSRESTFGLLRQVA